MRRLAVFLILTIALGIAGGAIGLQALTARHEPVKRTPLLRMDLAECQGKEAVVILAVIAPGATAGKHFHPGQEFVYVLEGSGIFTIEGRPSVNMKAGDVIQVPPKQVHSNRNGSKTAPLRVLGFLVGEKGQPLTTEVK